MINSLSNDLIVGAYTNYNWNQIKYWANSIDRCGFTGDKAVIVYNSDEDTVKKLSDLNFKVIVFNQDPISKNYYWPQQNLIIVVQRFFHLWQYLNTTDIDYRYVITTDVKDVVFQTNPSVWLETYIGTGETIVASSESIKYKDEPWGNDNLRASYPMMYDEIKEKTIWNCGVQAGTPTALKELWLQIWFICQRAGRYNPDQAAYNILLNTIAYKKLTRFVHEDEGWAAQLGTTMDETKMNYLRPVLLDPEPTFDGKHVLNSLGIPFSIVHQYDRIKSLKNIIENNYG